MADITVEKQYSFNSLEDRLIKDYFSHTAPAKKMALKGAEVVGAYVAPFVGGFLAGISEETGLDLARYQTVLLCGAPAALATGVRGWMAKSDQATYKAVLSNDAARKDLVSRIGDDPRIFRKVKDMREAAYNTTYVRDEVGVAASKGLLFAGAGFFAARMLRRYL